MQTQFKRHQKVRLLRVPAEEDIDPFSDENPDSEKVVQIKAGMEGKINIILPNGRYHVAILDKKGQVIAYAAIDEDALESAE